ncbi:NO-inducible flavohemoprotein [Paenibacillus sp. GCM10027626]|uniref:NO-inducible flavohemoprotein n=1 Tax=Paenibacillus sp. GCM10027626 TaxID=3273411 RepID=UPI0036274539
MLATAAIDIIRSTVPLLETHGEAITKRFYEQMFAAHPELLNIFNHANQKQGRQQAALANAVYAAAVHIDRLEQILPVVKQIAHKHRSLGVKPEHYPIVGHHLLAAIKDVLGEAATEEVLAAWAEAYGVIADAFIGVEADMYAAAERQQGGWEEFRPFIIAKKVPESSVITSFYLQPEDGKAIAVFEPGQYISVKLSIPGEVNTHIRQYSLSDAPGKPYYRISVKREDAAKDKPAGIVSNYLHQQLAEGDRLLLSAPAGDFTLGRIAKPELSRPLVFISGGVGITPLMSMLLHLQQTEPERKVTFIHAALDGQTQAMREDMVALAENNAQLTVHFCYQRPTVEDKRSANFSKEGRIDLPWLQTVIPAAPYEASYYCCGPVPFMKQIYNDLGKLGVPAEQIHYEFFGPAGKLE